MLEENGISLSEEIRAAAELTDYAVGARYPDPMEPVTEDEYKEAVKAAEAVVSWAETLVVSGTEKNTNDCP